MAFLFLATRHETSSRKVNRDGLEDKTRHVILRSKKIENRQVTIKRELYIIYMMQLTYSICWSLISKVTSAPAAAPKQMRIWNRLK